MFSPSDRTTYSSARSSSRTHERPIAASTRNGSTASPRASSAKASQRGVRSTLGTFDHPRAQQARGTEHEHGDQHEEREHVLIVAAQKTAGQVADVAGAEGLDQPQQQPPQHGAGQIADA